MARSEALILAQDLGVDKMQIASDCLEVVNSLLTPNFSRYSVVLEEIKKHSYSFAYVILSLKVGSRIMMLI